MATSRKRQSAIEKLRAANERNAVTRGETSTDDTVFGDFANREEASDIKENDNTDKEEIISISEENTTPSEDNNISKSDTAGTSKIKKTVASKTVKKPAKTKMNSDKSVESGKVTKPIEKDKIKSEQETSDIEPEYVKMMAMTLSIPEEINEYLNIKPAMAETSMKQIFEDAVINASKAPINDELARQFRKSQHSGIRRSIRITEELKNTMKKEAVRFLMKPTAFATYCLTKAYNEDTEYHKAMNKLK